MIFDKYRCKIFINRSLSYKGSYSEYLVKNILDKHGMSENDKEKVASF